MIQLRLLNGLEIQKTMLSIRLTHCMLDFSLQSSLFTKKLLWRSVSLLAISWVVNSSSKNNIALKVTNARLDQSMPDKLCKLASFVFNSVFIWSSNFRFDVDEDSNELAINFANLKSARFPILWAGAFSNFEHTGS